MKTPTSEDFCLVRYGMLEPKNDLVFFGKKINNNRFGCKIHTLVVCDFAIDFFDFGFFGTGIPLVCMLEQKMNLEQS